MTDIIDVSINGSNLARRGFFSCIKCLLSRLIEIPEDQYPNVRISFESEAYGTPGLNIYNELFNGDGIIVRDIPQVPSAHPSHPNFPPGNINVADRARFAPLLKRFFRIKPGLINSAGFIGGLAGDRILTVHYRGTDSCADGRNHSIPLFLSTCERLFRTGGFDAVFLATDSKECQEVFGLSNLPVITNDHLVSDSKAGLHNVDNDPKRLREEAVIDCWTLAMGDLFVSGSSNLSEVAAMISPDMPWLRLI